MINTVIFKLFLNIYSIYESNEILQKKTIGVLPDFKYLIYNSMGVNGLKKNGHS